jgi:hypothetical protein
MAIMPIVEFNLRRSSYPILARPVQTAFPPQNYPKKFLGLTVFHSKSPHTIQTVSHLKVSNLGT